MKNLPLLFICLMIGINNPAFSQCLDVDAIVAKDGTGDYNTIQEAINAAPPNGEDPFKILIKKGLYEEKLFFEKSNIILVGENRSETIISAAILRRQWRENNPSDWGAATINIKNEVTDLTFANLTIQNNFAEVFPDFPNNNDHSFAIRGGGHRIIIVNCNVTSTGGDTLSLWNTDGGMFYHNACYFEGYVDFLAPRGYCFVTDSKFFGYNSTASIWHDGSGGEDHKLVIRNSNFDGKKGFALGRYHKDAQFYLLDCSFSENMKNQKIYWEAREEIQWPADRVYYHNTHRPIFDWSWHRDNLDKAPNSLHAEELTANWTFKGEWNPEALLDYLLPKAFLPNPTNESCTSTSPMLKWVPARCATRHLLYLGKEVGALKLRSIQDSSRYQVDDLEENTLYYWRVDEIINHSDTVEGPTWQFRTAQITDFKPTPSFSPDPADGANYFTNLVRIGWEYDKCSVDSSYIFFGNDPENLSLRGKEKYGAFFLSNLDKDSTYYWRIDTKNQYGITKGNIWSFTLNPTVTNIKEQRNIPFKFSQNYPNPAKDNTQIEFQIPERGLVQLQLLNVNGQVIQELLSERLNAGKYEFPINVKPYLGMIICRMSYQGKTKSIKMLVE